MIKLLHYIFIEKKNLTENEKRTKYGYICGGLGIFLNLCLFSLKLFAGIITGSISVKTDAFNNLSDAGSSLVTLLGFKLSSKKPDKGHPFGHGRYEYISSFIVALIICLMGFELGKESIQKLLNPVEPAFDYIAIVILIASVLVKLYMFIYNKRIGVRIDSPTLKATATDSISDAVATGVTILALVINKFWNVNIDAYCGILLSLLIFRAGFLTIRETLQTLLGPPPDEKLVKQIENIVMDNDIVVGVHDLIVHDYGPGRRMISIHAEVPLDGDLATMHDCIDNIERRISTDLGCHAVIHMDPVMMGNERVDNLKSQLKEVIASLQLDISIHDFRVVTGPSHTNLIFDAVVPLECKYSDNQVVELICEGVRNKIGKNFYCVIEIDKPYV